VSNSDEISGSVERITYYNEQNGYSVLRLKPDSRNQLPFKYASGRDELITVIGNLPELQPGEWVKLQGRWTTHPQHGRQFNAEQCYQSLPASSEGIKRYLGSGLIRGVGKKMAERIVNQFGEGTLDVIEQEPERLYHVVGIGKKRVEEILRAWQEQKAIKDVMIFLQSHDISTGLATKIYKQYENESLTVVRERPYQMVQDIHGIGFKTADKIAQALGLAADDPSRIEAGIAYTLNRKAQEGHVYVPQAELEPEAAGILGVQEERVRYVIESLEGSELVKRESLLLPTGENGAVQETTAVYLTPFYYAEIGVTNRVQRLLDHPTSRLHGLSTRPWPRTPASASLSQQQSHAIRQVAQQKVTILTGGPGTGKTTTLRVLLDWLESGGYTCLLASPTGRAAKRLAEATGREAKTIHRLLEFKPGQGFLRNEEYPLAADLVVVDEASMLDLLLANNLLKAMPLDAHLLLVGDIDQLPAVGAGDVLRDLIASGKVGVSRLTEIFRQAANSLIIQNAHRINHGQMPLTPPDAKDFFLFVKPDPTELASLIVDIVQRRIPTKFGLDPFKDVQVLCPMYNGAVGVANLNLLLQEGLNPPSGRKAERRLGGRVIRVGAKVMQTVNNYDKGVFNGDIGRVVQLDVIGQTVTVNMDGLPVVYSFLEVDELVHAFAISVHKSQGSEYACVVMPVVTQHYMMLQRNLLYTAVTRAKQIVILAGTRRAIGMAISNNRTVDRHTALDHRLQQK
jgi:exodeoxyribonuclease V alpha subunit